MGGDPPASPSSLLYLQLQLIVFLIVQRRFLVLLARPLFANVLDVNLGTVPVVFFDLVGNGRIGIVL